MNGPRWTTIGALVKESGGSIKTGPFGTAFKATEYSQQGVPVISVGEVGYGRLRITEGTRRVGPEVTRRLPEFVLKSGDIVFGRKRAVERSACVREGETGYFLGSDGIRVRLGSTVDPRFIVHQIQSDYVRAWLIRHAIGSAIPTLNQAILGRVPIFLPSIEEQRSISEELLDADESTMSIERIIFKKQAIKRAAMQQLLTSRARLPGFTGVWGARKIGDFALVRAGGTPSTSVPRYWGGDISWMNSGDIHQKQVWNVMGRITRSGLRESSAQIFPAQTVLIALAGQGKTRGSTAISRIFLATNQSIAGIYPGSDHDSDYLYYNLDSRYSELRGESTGDGGRGGLNLTIIKSLEVPLPRLEEQKEISRVLLDFDAELQALDRRLAKAKAVKQGMMQLLFTGRLRMPVLGGTA